jgi:hypothetical protein
MTNHNQVEGKEFKKPWAKITSKHLISKRVSKLKMKTKSRGPTGARHSRLPRSCAFNICVRKMQQYLMK